MNLFSHYFHPVSFNPSLANTLIKDNGFKNYPYNPNHTMDEHVKIKHEPKPCLVLSKKSFIICKHYSALIVVNAMFCTNLGHVV